MVNSANRDRDRGRDRDDDRDRGRGKGGFVYRERSNEDVKKRVEQRGGSYDSPIKEGIDTWRAKPGENEVRILPPSWDDVSHYGYDLWVHSFIGPDQSTFLCLKKMFKKDCPCCEASAEAKKEGETEDARELAVKHQVAVWIIDRDDRDETPKLWQMGWTIDREIAAQSSDKKQGKVLLIDHPDEGYDVTFRREGQKLNTKYVGVSIARQASPICERAKDQQKILDFIEANPIPSLLREHSYEYMAKALMGTVAKPDEDLDDKRGRRSSRDDKDGDEDDRRGSRRARDDDSKDSKDEEDRGSRRERSSRDDKDEEDRGSRRERSRSRDDEEEKGGKDERKEEGRERSTTRRGRDDADSVDNEREGRRSRRDDDDSDSDRSEGRSSRRSSRDDKDGDESEDRRSSRRSSDDEPDNKRERSTRSRDEEDDKGAKDDSPPGRRRAREDDDDSKDEEDRGTRRGKGKAEKEEKDTDEDRPRRSRRAA